MKQATFYLANMCCSSEESLVRKHLGSMAGVTELRYQVMDRRLIVQHDLVDERPIFQALEKLGMGPHREALPGPEARARSRNSLGLALAGGLAVVCEVVAYRGVSEGSALVVCLAVASMLLSGRETFAKGWAALRSLSFNRALAVTKYHHVAAREVVGSGPFGQRPSNPVDGRAGGRWSNFAGSG